MESMKARQMRPRRMRSHGMRRGAAETPFRRGASDRGVSFVVGWIVNRQAVA